MGNQGCLAVALLLLTLLAMSASDNVSSCFAPAVNYSGYTDGPTYIDACLGNATAGFSPLRTGASPGQNIGHNKPKSLRWCLNRCEGQSECKAIIYWVGQRKCIRLGRKYDGSFENCKTESYCSPGEVYVTNKVNQLPHWVGTLEDAQSKCLADDQCGGVWDYGDDGDDLITGYDNPWRYCKEKPKNTNDVLSHDRWMVNICTTTSTPTPTTTQSAAEQAQQKCIESKSTYDSDINGVRASKGHSTSQQNTNEGWETSCWNHACNNLGADVTACKGSCWSCNGGTVWNQCSGGSCCALCKSICEKACDFYRNYFPNPSTTSVASVQCARGTEYCKDSNGNGGNCCNQASCDIDEIRLLPDPTDVTIQRPVCWYAGGGHWGTVDWKRVAPSTGRQITTVTTTTAQLNTTDAAVFKIQPVLDSTGNHTSTANPTTTVNTTTTPNLTIAVSTEPPSTTAVPTTTANPAISTNLTTTVNLTTAGNVTTTADSTSTIPTTTADPTTTGNLTTTSNSTSTTDFTTTNTTITADPTSTGNLTTTSNSTSTIDSTTTISTTTADPTTTGNLTTTASPTSTTDSTTTNTTTSADPTTTGNSTTTANTTSTADSTTTIPTTTADLTTIPNPTANPTRAAILRTTTIPITTADVTIAANASANSTTTVNPITTADLTTTIPTTNANPTAATQTTTNPTRTANRTTTTIPTTTANSTTTADSTTSDPVTTATPTNTAFFLTTANPTTNTNSANFARLTTTAIPTTTTTTIHTTTGQATTTVQPTTTANPTSTSDFIWSTLPVTSSLANPTTTASPITTTNPITSANPTTTSTSANSPNATTTARSATIDDSTTASNVISTANPTTSLKYATSADPTSSTTSINSISGISTSRMQSMNTTHAINILSSSVARNTTSSMATPMSSSAVSSIGASTTVTLTSSTSTVTATVTTRASFPPTPSPVLGTSTPSSTTIIPALQFQGEVEIATSVEDELLDSLIEDLQSGGVATNDSVLPSVSKLFDKGIVVASVVTANQSSSNVTVASASTDVAIQLPAEAVNASGLVVMITAFNDSVVGMSEDGVILRSPPVGLRLIDSVSGEERSDSLGFWVKVRVAASREDGEVCAFWEESNLRWSTEGLRDVVASDGSFWCETWHLTFFGVISMPIKQVGQAIRCSNLGVFTVESFKALRGGHWAQRPAACILWSLSAFLLAVLVLAKAYDYHMRGRLQLWHDELLLVHGPDDRECWLLSVTRDMCQTCVLDVLGVVRNADKLKMLNAKFAAGVKDAKEGELNPDASRSVHISKSKRRLHHRFCCPCCVNGFRKSVKAVSRHAGLLLMASVMRVSTSDLKHHLKEMKKSAKEFAAKSLPTMHFSAASRSPVADSDNSQPSIPASSNSKPSADPSSDASSDTSSDRAGVELETLCPHIVSQISDRQDAILKFMEGFSIYHSFSLLFSFFVAAHPTWGVFSFSMFSTASMEAIVVCASLMGPAMLAALFFTVSGDALTINSYADCEVTGAREFWRNVAVGLISWGVSTLPLLLTGSLMKRHFVHKHEWSYSDKMRWLRWWRWQDRILYYGLLLYCIGCALFVACFLANVREEDEYMWIISLITTLVEDFFIAPLCIALALLLLTCVVRCFAPAFFHGVMYGLRCDEASKRYVTKHLTNFSGSTQKTIRSNDAHGVSEEYEEGDLSREHSSICDMLQPLDGGAKGIPIFVVEKPRLTVTTI